MKRRPPREPEVEWAFRPRIEPGDYPAFSRGASIYRDAQYKRWVCAVQFEILDDSLTRSIATLTWFLSLGSREKPRAGRRGNYWVAWVKANGGGPKRKDRVSPHIFERRHAKVRVEDTTKNHRQMPVGTDDCYSVIRDVIEWHTVRDLDSAARVGARSQSNNHSNQLIKAGM